ncbi:hypothetical protein GR183_17475 [Stappia sp. GBMRC 2046]|uniref:Uncharacterized protein n=2 Tax=Stappia sediminis TaxID=2692190 RepID=A0A7X3LX82_9HYPH|nr:hypothetical protein [Stappia sediminis]
MTDEVDEADQDIAEEVLPEAVADAAVPIELQKLFPWHKPRKQYIRRRQWIEHANRLIGRLIKGHSLVPGSNGGDEIRYLTLPGTDYLDVKMLAECCKANGCSLTSTGFLAAGTGNPMKARAEVRQDALIKAGHITDRSYTVWRQLEEVSSTKSAAYADLRRRGPFHIVNIDACGSLALPSSSHDNRLVDAIHRIVEMQIHHCTTRWLLYITVDVRKENLNKSTLESLTDAIRENASNSEEFKSQTISMFGVGDYTLEGVLTAASSDDGSKFLQLFSLGFAKWLLHLAESKLWGLKVHNSYYYSTAEADVERPTMPCLVFEFVPPPMGLPDPYRVIRTEPAQGGSDEDFSMRALDKVGSMRDLDQIIACDDGLRRSLVSETKELLEDVGYTATALSTLEEFSAALGAL